MPDGKIENSSSVSPTPALLQIFPQFSFVLSNVSQTLNKFAAPTHIQLGKEISISFFAGALGICKGFFWHGHIAFSVYLGAGAGALRYMIGFLKLHTCS